MPEEQAVKPKKQKAETLLTFKEKITYLIASLGFAESSLAVTTYIMYFYTDVMKIGAAVAGTIGMIVTIFDAINDPLIGHYTSNHKAKNGDSIRQHLLYWAVPFGVFCVLMWYSPEISIGMKIAYALIVRCTISVFTTFIRIPLRGMLHLSSPLMHDRAVMGEVDSIGSLIGFALSVVGLYPLVILFGGGSSANGTAIDEKRGFFLMGVFCAVVASVPLILYYFASKERVHDERPEEKLNLWQNFSILFKDKFFRRIISFEILGNLTDASVTATMTYYCKYVVGNAKIIIPVFGALLVAGAVAAPFSEKVAKKWGAKTLFIVGQGFCVILAQAIVVLRPTSVPILIACGALHGVKLAICNAALPIYYGISNDKLAQKNDGKRVDGMFLMFGGLFKKLGQAIITFMIGIGLSSSGYDGTLEVQSESAMHMLKFMFIYVPLIFGVVCLLFAIKYMDFEKD